MTRPEAGSARRITLERAALALALVAGCTGAIDGDESSGLAPDGTPTVPGPPTGGGSGARGPMGGAGGGTVVIAPPPAGAPESAGPLPLRRLTRLEIDNTLRDLLGDTTRPASAALPPEGAGSSGFDLPGLVQTVDAERIREVAEGAAERASRRLSELVPCATGATEETCAQRFIAELGKRAYRRPLTAGEAADLLALYRKARTDAGRDHPNALRVLLTAMLQAPQFLYRWELGPQSARKEGALIRLGPYELASRLSYFLLGSMPDAALFAAADEGRLTSAQDVEREAKRLLASERARDAVNDFVAQWLQVEGVLTAPKDPKLFPELNTALREAMLDETRTFASKVVLEGDGRFSTLLTARFSFLNAPLAKLYGVTGVTSSTLQRTSLEGVPRHGVLTHASLLSVGANAHETYPHLRGKLVRERLLCQFVPPAPPNGIPDLPAAKPNQSTRDRFAEHVNDDVCRACHGLMDPIGFGLESYDAIGRFRATDNGKAVDARGTVSGLDGETRTFNGPAELAALLVASPQARSCMARQWFRFAFSRPETAQDEASLSVAFDAFLRAETDVRELMVAITKTRSFLYRTPSEGEVLQ